MSGVSRGFWSTASVASSALMAVISSTSMRMSESIDFLSSGERSSRCSNSLLARNEVSGVRNSWFASCTNRRSRSKELRMVLIMRLKLAASDATSRGPASGTSLSSRPVAAMSSAAAASERNGAVMRDASHQLTAAARMTSATPTLSSHRPTRRRVSLISPVPRATCSAPPPRIGTTYIRIGSPATLTSWNFGDSPVATAISDFDIGRSSCPMAKTTSPVEVMTWLETSNRASMSTSPSGLRNRRPGVSNKPRGESSSRAAMLDTRSSKNSST